tara:strand:- start:3969 stop:4355 length:387 start_codon:yes stop_codon:yes gene_type:complete
MTTTPKNYWKTYSVGQLDSVLLQLVACESAGQAPPTARELSSMLGISLANTRGALSKLSHASPAVVCTSGTRREGKRGFASSQYGVTARGKARVDAKIRALLECRFGGTPPEQALDEIITILSPTAAA